MLHHKTIDHIFRTITRLPPTEPSLNDLLNYDKAQDLCFQAWNLERDAALELAVEATKHSRFCSDAYNIFAQYLALNDAECLSLYKWAARIGEIYFGKQFFEKERGYFYGLVKTRPYMRARRGVADSLRDLGCYEESIEHFEELLELDTGDHQGSRLVLMSAYLELYELEKAKMLIDKHRDNSGPYAAYSAVLWSALSQTTKNQFEDELALALRENQFVPKLLEAPEQKIERSSFGVDWSGLDGAEDYLFLSRRLWDFYPDIKKRVVHESKILLPKVLAKREEEWDRYRKKILGH